MTPNSISNFLSQIVVAQTNLNSFKNEKDKNIILNFNLELLALLYTLKSIGILTFKIVGNSIILSLTPNTFSTIQIHSRPSRRIMISYKNLWTHNNGRGISILRTSKGFLTTTEARTLRIGGELLFTIL